MLVFAVMENNCLEERDSDWKNIHEYCGNMLLASSREMLEKDFVKSVAGWGHFGWVFTGNLVNCLFITYAN